MRKLLIGIICLCIFACQSENKNKDNTDSVGNGSSAGKVDTLSFTYDSVKVYSRAPISKDPLVTDTSKAVIVFPKFQDSTLNKLIEARVAKNTANPDVTYNSYEDVANSFVKRFDEYLTYDEDHIQTWFLDVKVDVIHQSAGLVALKFSQIDYMGGAHPNSSFTYVNYDRSNQAVLTLDSVLKANTFSKLQSIAEQIFRKNEGLGPNQSLANTYFFDKDTFHLNSNFTITKTGLEFLYNPYEIKPYAAGITTLIIPYSAIKDLIKPNSIIYRINNENAGI